MLAVKPIVVTLEVLTSVKSRIFKDACRETFDMLVTDEVSKEFFRSRLSKELTLRNIRTMLSP